MRKLRKYTLEQLHQQFLFESRFAAKRAEATLTSYCDSFRLFCKIMPDVGVEDLTPAALVEFFRRLDTRKRIVGRGMVRTGVKSSTIATHRGKLSPFFRWLVKQGYLQEHPFEHMPHPRVAYDDRKYLKRGQVECIFTALGFVIPWKSDLVKTRNIAIFSVLLNCGLRKGELLGLGVLDVNLEARELKVRAATSKARRGRVVPMNARVRSDVTAYLNERKRLGYANPSLFVSANQDKGLSAEGFKHLLEKVKEYADVHFHAHQFRHTFAVNMLKNGTDIERLRQLLGHKGLEMTSQYLRCLPTKMTQADVERLSMHNLI